MRSKAEAAGGAAIAVGEAAKAFGGGLFNAGAALFAQQPTTASSDEENSVATPRTFNLRS